MYSNTCSYDSDENNCNVLGIYFLALILLCDTKKISKCKSHMVGSLVKFCPSYNLSRQ